MRISELFESIQGEGRHAGVPSVFVRTTGCNLRCWFCDTPYTSWNPEGEQRAWETVLVEVLDYGIEHVVVTGGEPMLQPDVVPLTRALGQDGRFVTIETAGTVHRPVHADLMSISPKLANSTPGSPRWAARHNRLRHDRVVLERLLSEYVCQLKYVIDKPADLADVTNHIAEFPAISPDAVWLMPQGVTADVLGEKTEWLEEEARRRGFRVSPRLHIELFGNVRGT